MPPHPCRPVPAALSPPPPAKSLLQHFAGAHGFCASSRALKRCSGENWFRSPVSPAWRKPACVSGGRPQDGQGDLSQRVIFARAALLQLRWFGVRQACSGLHVDGDVFLEQARGRSLLGFPFIPPGFHFKAVVRGVGRQWWVLGRGRSPPVPAQHIKALGIHKPSLSCQRGNTLIPQTHFSGPPN